MCVGGGGGGGGGDNRNKCAKIIRCHATKFGLQRFVHSCVNHLMKMSKTTTNSNDESNSDPMFLF